MHKFLVIISCFVLLIPSANAGNFKTSGQISVVEAPEIDLLVHDGVEIQGIWVPAALALKFCMKNKTCRKIAARSTAEAIKWAIEHLF